ncbi:MAG TPA: hypothetical protein VFJ13_07220 [Paracoccaceae bacterium]|nr:hypothetical protein [Paracoccaceae bacterium]
MSESDSFIQEVTEEVRQDRMFALWKKWGPYILAVIVLAVGGAALWTWMEARERARAEQVGGILLGAEPASVEEQQTAVAVLEPPARIVAEFAAAAALADAGDTAGAAEAYRALAARGDLAQHYRDLAVLQALRIEATTADPAAALADLAPLMEPGAPYAPLARELAAVLHMRAGDIEAARAELEAILADARTTQALRLRARELMNVVGAPETDGAG